MENQNLQWTSWDDQSDNTPTTPQNPNIKWESYDNSTKPDPQNHLEWENPMKTPLPNWGEQSQPQETTNTQNLYEPLNSEPIIIIEPAKIKINASLDTAVKDLDNSNLNLLDKVNSKYSFDPKPNTGIGNIIEAIVKIGIEQNLKVDECFIYKIQPNESVFNPNLKKSKTSFFFYLQTNSNGGILNLDFTSLGGPSIPNLSYNSGELSIIPGWIPATISKNESSEEIIIIAGTLN